MLTEPQKVDKKIPRRYLNITNAALYTSLSRRKLDTDKDDGLLPYSRVGGRVVFDIQDLDAYIRAGRVDILADVRDDLNSKTKRF